MPDDAVINLTQIENLRRLFDEEFKELVESFLTEFEEKEKILATAIKDKKNDVVIKTAHFLKGSSLNMGAEKLGKICDKIEVAGKHNNLEEVNTQYKTLQTIYTETKSEFLKLI